MDFKDLTYEIAQCYIRDHMSSLSTDVSNRLLGWCRSRDHQKLASCSGAFPLAFASWETLKILRQTEALFKKSKVFSESDVCRQAAIDSFKRAERICRVTNRRLEHYYLKPHRLDADLKLWVSRSTEWIASVLGNFDDFLEGLPSLIRFTAGATASTSRRNSQPHQKVKLRMHMTSGSVKYARALASFWGYGPLRPFTTVTNRVEFVPKSWKTDRTIACEPEGSLSLQLAFDTYCKSRLRKRRIDLSDQNRNQELAKEASISGKYATLDLSMASDTLSFNTVALLLPKKWFNYLNDVRSPFGRSSFGTVKYAKFSSMGNGATFALETLVFASACVAVGSREFSVYGDDIIIETELYHDLQRYLRYLGFVVNREKSFHTGPFRESCGKDFYEGRDITPFYLREWSGLSAQFCHNVNGLVSVSRPWGLIWKLCRDLSRQKNLLEVPVNYDSMSGVFISPYHAYSKKLITSKDQIQRFRSYVRKSRSRRTEDSRSLFLWFLDRNRIRKDDLDSPVIRSRTSVSSHKYVRKWVHWILPVVGAPDHLFWWSEFISLDESREG